MDLAIEIEKNNKKMIVDAFAESLNSVEPIKVTHLQLSPQEMKLMAEFNALPQKDKKEVVRLMKEEKEKVKSERKLKNKKLLKKAKKNGAIE